MHVLIKIEPCGKRYGLWEVIGFAGSDKRHNAMWSCKCAGCGRSFEIRGFSLRGGTSKSCKKCARKRK